jgi:hypothetical protein
MCVILDLYEDQKQNIVEITRVLFEAFIFPRSTINQFPFLVCSFYTIQLDEDIVKNTMDTTHVFFYASHAKIQWRKTYFYAHKTQVIPPGTTQYQWS